MVKGRVVKGSTWVVAMEGEMQVVKRREKGGDGGGGGEGEHRCASHREGANQCELVAAVIHACMVRQG